MLLSTLSIEGHATAAFLHPTRACARRRDGREPRQDLRLSEAWLRGVGCVPLYNLMEDAATAEISRAQIWAPSSRTAARSTQRCATPCSTKSSQNCTKRPGPRLVTQRQRASSTS